MLLTKLEDGSSEMEQVDCVKVGKARLNLLRVANLVILPRRLELFTKW
jgi:hypothetical protein